MSHIIKNKSDSCVKEKTKSRFILGKVIKTSLDAVTVECVKYKKHLLYKKYVKKRKKYIAHDSNNKCKVGDNVQIVSSNHFSKKKFFLLVKVFEEKLEGGRGLDSISYNS